MNVEQIDYVKKIAKKDPIIEELLRAYLMFSESPLISSYFATFNTIERWNSQLENNDIDILNSEDKTKFEMAHKYLIELDGYLETLEKIRKRMMPEMQENLNDIKKAKKMGKINSVAI